MPGRKIKPEPVGYAVAGADGVLLYFDGRVLMRRYVGDAYRDQFRPGKATVFPDEEQARQAIVADRNALVMAGKKSGGRIGFPLADLPQPAYTVVPLFTAPPPAASSPPGRRAPASG